MREIASNTKGGIEPPVLSRSELSMTGEALWLEASPFYQLDEVGRYFLISNGNNKYTPSNDSNKPTKPKRTKNRKRIIYDDTFTHGENTYPVNPTKTGLYVEILQRIIEQYEAAKLKWKRVFVYRFDLHSDYLTKDNKGMTVFRNKLFKRLRRKYGFKEIGFCWVREQERAKSQHYHWVLFLDGDLIQHPKILRGMIKEAWEKVTGGYTMPTVPNPFYFVDNEETEGKAINRASYLAKPRGKGYRPAQTKDFQCSRMKPLP
jgi:hypothetical protein